MPQNKKSQETGGVRILYELKPNTDAEQMLDQMHRDIYKFELETPAITAYVDVAVFAIHGDMPCLDFGPKAENVLSFDE